MFSLFYTLFKYKEKAQKDELGNYPEKVEVRAFPERRYLWTSRFFVVLSSLTLCLNMILGSVLCLLIPQRKAGIMPLQIDYNRYQVTAMEPAIKRVYAGDLVTESLMAKYVETRYTISEDYEELKNRLGETDFVFLASSSEVYNNFSLTERPYFEALHQRGIRRKVDIKRIYPVSMDFWQVRFDTIESSKESDKLVIEHWIATLRMNFNAAKYGDTPKEKERELINPFGITVTRYDISYMGKTIKKKSEKNTNPE